MKGIIKSGVVFICVMFAVRAIASDTIVVVKDPRMDVLSAKQVLANKKAAMLTANGMYKGYRIQVISTTRRDDAFRVKAELLARFPDQKSYAVYQSPNFKIRIGNFIKKEDAEQFKLQLNRMYPQGVYIVEDGIEYTPPKEEEAIP